MNKKLIIILLSLVTCMAMGQSFQPIMPLNTPPLLAGNFAELRPNHFHGGLDFKTLGKEGLEVLAAQDGYISRIKVSPYGYGKTLYITHANGYVTTYNHLQKYAPEIEAFVKKKQYEKQSYDIDIIPTEDMFVVKKGDWVAVSGNTGSSQGPHLHFEVRDTSNNGWNPLLFGFNDIEDTTPPEVTQLFAYSLSEDAQVEETQLPRQIHKTKQPDGTYLADKISAIGTIGFGFSAYDKQDGTAHKNGIYKATLQLNGETQLVSAFDKVNFDDTRYINVLVDYPHYIDHKGFVQLLYKAPGNKLEIYPVLNPNNGYLTIAEGQQYTVTVIVEDFKGNATRINIPIEGARTELKTPRPENKGNTEIIASRDNYYELPNGNVYFPENTFYENIKISLSGEGESVQIGDYKTPIHKFYTLSIKNTKYKDDEVSRVYISRGGSFEPTVYKDGFFTARVRGLGRFSLRKDETPPIVKALNFKSKGSVKADVLKLSVSDNLSGFSHCSATLNGQWILFEYEPKNHTLNFNFADITPSDSNSYDLEVKAFDKAGNVGTLKATFTR